MFVSGIEHSSMSEWMREIEFSAMKHAINKRHLLFLRKREAVIHVCMTNSLLLLNSSVMES